MTKQSFWKVKNLGEMSSEEWEMLCDGCGRCCLLKLEDEDSGSIAYTRVACELLDHNSCRCSDYPNRTVRVPECLWLTPDNLETLGWLPATCAYRLLYEGKPLPDWHPLLTGDPTSVQRAGISVHGRILSERHVHPDGLEEHIIHWVE